jgi:hypothetical protein
MRPFDDHFADLQTLAAIARDAELSPSPRRRPRWHAEAPSGTVYEQSQRRARLD